MQFVRSSRARSIELVAEQSLRSEPTPLDFSGRRALTEASKAIDLLMLDEAAQVLENVLNEVSARPAQLRDPTWYAEAYQTLGIVYGLRGERDRARSVWSTSKRLAPDLLPNPALLIRRCARSTMPSKWALSSVH